MMSIVYPFGHLLLACLEAVILFFSVRLCRQSVSVAMIVLPIVVGGIIYDNIILGIGNFLGEGELLVLLSRVRFLLHFIAIPLLIVVGVELSHRAGAKWANSVARSISWILAMTFIVISIINDYVDLELIAIDFMGMLRYGNAKPQNIPIVTIAINIFVLLIGVGIWVRIQWKWLFFGTLVSLVGNAIPVSIVGTLPGSTSEFIMAVCLLFTEIRIGQLSDRPKLENSFNT
jgi:hypothetical protein